MEYYLKITEDGVIYGKKNENEDDVVYDESLSFKDFEEGYEWLIEKFGVAKSDIQYIHQLEI